ncbi:MAG: hypothetical protein J6R80_01375 [Kiritimatiellae bacterium]|nr:hypothetical protein [Kiritimatiellia bacterium]
MFKKLHNLLGDFWWYSLMVFCAARAADVLNLFVGVYLVPKYVSTEELGAVQPLASFANFLVIPAAVFATTFRQEISNLATRGEFGRMKSLMRGVFIATAITFVLAILSMKLVLPLFLERLRIVNGSLGIVILTTSLLCTVSSVYAIPLQTLKKFRATSLISVLSAPIRFVVMVITMPLRALTGYFVGQGSTPAFSILASIIALRKELSVRAEPYWTKAIVVRFTRLFIIFGISTLAGSFLTLVENTIIRQRLPDLDSAAYYMVTRFSDISTFLATALSFTLFPFAAELSAKGGGTNRLVVKSSLVLFAGNFILAIFFLCFGRQILTFLPNGQSYSIYAWAIPVIIAVTTVNSIVSFYCVAEMSANRFGFMYFTVPICLISGLGLMLVTGQGYYLSYLPQPLAAFLKAHNILTLKSVIVWMLVVAVVRLVCCVCYANLISRRAAFCSELEK